jgi:hypothetical protein
VYFQVPSFVPIASTLYTRDNTLAMTPLLIQS